MKVYISKITNPGRLKQELHQALVWLGSHEMIKRGHRVLLKPNFTWRAPIPGVTTTPAFVEATVSVIKEFTDRIIIAEADGGYHSFVAEEAFRSHGLYELALQYGVELRNLSREPVAMRTVLVKNRPIQVEFPQVLLDEIDFFVSLPVPKVHVLTGVSLGLKNQWGCLPGTMRLRNHPIFARKILAINKLIQPRLVLFDGTYFLDRTGPMVGRPVRMDLVIAADDVGAGDLVCCEIMGIAPERIRYLRLAQKEKVMPVSLNEVALNHSLETFKTHRFRLRRALIHYVALAAFRSRMITRLFYDSPAAGPIHRVLYAIRRNRWVSRLLYGPAGLPPV